MLADLSARIMRPTIKLSAKNPQMALFAHYLSLVSGFFGALYGFFGLVGDNLLGSIIGMLSAIFILSVELNYYNNELLKKPEIRGFVWIIFGVLSTGVSWTVTILIVLSGILYLVYYYDE